MTNESARTGPYDLSDSVWAVVYALRTAISFDHGDETQIQRQHALNCLRIPKMDDTFDAEVFNHH
jgi:hypothetical protein